MPVRLGQGGWRMEVVACCCVFCCVLEGFPLSGVVWNPFGVCCVVCCVVCVVYVLCINLFSAYEA